MTYTFHITHFILFKFKYMLSKYAYICCICFTFYMLFEYAILHIISFYMLCVLLVLFAHCCITFFVLLFQTMFQTKKVSAHLRE